MTQAVLPCPYCHRPARLNNMSLDHFTFVQCLYFDDAGVQVGCGATGPLCKTGKEAVDLWNTVAERASR